MKRFQSAIAWGILGLFTGTMVCGEGLHWLCGFHHVGCCSHGCGSHPCGHGDHDSAKTGDIALFETPAHGAGPPNEADCPICGFFALAHALPTPSQVHQEPLPVADSAPPGRSPDAGDSILVYRSRAPPSRAL